MDARNFRLAAMAGLMALSAAALADEPTPKVGDETRAWLDLQKNAEVQNKRPLEPMPGEVADKVYQRYVESFGRPLPDKFPRDSFGMGSSGSGGQ